MDKYFDASLWVVLGLTHLVQLIFRVKDFIDFGVIVSPILAVLNILCLVLCIIFAVKIVKDVNKNNKEV